MSADAKEKEGTPDGAQRILQAPRGARTIEGRGADPSFWARLGGQNLIRSWRGRR